MRLIFMNQWHIQTNEMPAINNEKEAISVISHTSEGPFESIEPSSFWSKLLNSNWLDPSQGPVVIRPSEECSSLIIDYTARSLIDYLRQKAPEFKPICWDNRCGLTASLQELNKENSHLSSANFVWNAQSIFFPTGVPLSSAIFAPHCLITITTPFSDPQLRHSSILSVQAELISLSKILRNIFKMECIYEAHRLLRSDVVIVCGPVSKRNIEKGWFWAASNNDIGAEVIIARAAGLKAEDLPHIRYLQKHEIVRFDNLMVDGIIPHLEGYSASAVRAWCVRHYWRMLGKAWSFREDWKSFRMRIPQLSTAIKRRVSRKTEDNG